MGLLPLISARLEVSESHGGLLVSVSAVVVVAVCSIPLTAVVARWPRRPVLAGLLAGYAVSNALFAWTSRYGVALAARLVGGLAHAELFSMVFAVAVTVDPVTADPPLLPGAENPTVAWPFPAVAVTCVGAPGSPRRRS